ncbi:polysaccharide deacetylase, partial [Salinisphaera sp. USBA-960]|nr:polysaccharide deacetylase [Salifodinibacter halophilus]
PAGTPSVPPTSESPVPTPRFSYDDPSVDAAGDPLSVAFNSRERFRDAGWLVDDFEDERLWGTFAGRYAVEEDVVYCGSQSLR